MAGVKLANSISNSPQLPSCLVSVAVADSEDRLSDSPGSDGNAGRKDKGREKLAHALHLAGEDLTGAGKESM